MRALALALFLVAASAVSGDQVVQAYLARSQVRVYDLIVEPGAEPAVRLVAPDGFVLALYDPLGNFINGGAVEGGWLAVRPPSGSVGRYEVRVGSGRQSGNYTLTVEGGSRPGGSG